MYVLDGVVKTFEADSGKAVNSFFEHSGWVTEFISWFVKLCCHSSHLMHRAAMGPG